MPLIVTFEEGPECGIKSEIRGIGLWFLSMLSLDGISLTLFSVSKIRFHLRPCVMCKAPEAPLLIVNADFELLSSYKQVFFKVTQVCLALGIVLIMGHFLMQMGTLPYWNQT